MKTSKQFYKELTAKGLAKRKKKIHTKKEKSYLLSFLRKGMTILDLGCGYGRFTIPLAKLGYKMYGIDISPNLIKKAKEAAKKNKLRSRFRVGDMRKLPYSKNQFNTIFCMWSVFAELTKEKDQLKSLREMKRTLRKGGFALIDLPKPKRITGVIIDKARDLVQKKSKTKNVVESKIGGIDAMPSYMHTKKTLKELMIKLKPAKYQIYIDDFGGRDRLFLKFWK